MPGSNWQSLMVVAQTDGASLNTSTTETSILPAQAKITLPANYIDGVGKTFRVRAAGRASNIVTTPGTLTFRLKFGAVAVAASSAIALNTTAKTNVTFELNWEFTARSVGAAAALMHIGAFRSETVSGAAAGFTNTIMIPTSAPAVGTSFDSTVAQVVDLTAQFSISNAGNAIQVHQYVFESNN